LQLIGDAFALKQSSTAVPDRPLIAVSDVSARQHIRCATRRLLVVPHTRSTGLLCGRPVALKLSTRQLERSGSWQGQLQTVWWRRIYPH